MSALCDLLSQSPHCAAKLSYQLQTYFQSHLRTKKLKNSRLCHDIR